MKLNTSKSHVLMIPNVNNTSIKIDKFDISSSCEETLLGILIENKLTFEPRVENLCRKVANKLHAQIRMSKLMTTQQKRLVINAFIKSQFGYCTLIWMIHSRSANTHINRIHERAL